MSAEAYAPEVLAGVRGFCGWHIAPVQTGTFTFIANGACALILPTLKVVSVTSITEDGTAVDLSGVTVRESGILWREARWLRSPIVVTVEHGYEEFPPELVDAMSRFAASPRVPAGASVRVGNLSVSGSSSGMDGFSSSVLDRYRVRHAS